MKNSDCIKERQIPKSLKIKLKCAMEPHIYMLSGLVKEQEFVMDNLTLESVEDYVSRSNTYKGA